MNMQKYFSKTIFQFLTFTICLFFLVVENQKIAGFVKVLEKIIVLFALMKKQMQVTVHFVLEKDLLPVHFAMVLVI